MGAIASLMGGKVSIRQGKEFLYHQLYDQFIQEKEIKDFNDFHIAFLEIISTINSIVPGRHYDVPQRKDIEEAYDEWQKAGNEDEKKKVLGKLMEDKVKMRSADMKLVLTGLAAPPAAMAAKRAGESLPQLKILKAVPDLVFVPSATLLALAACKLSNSLKRPS